MKRLSFGNGVVIALLLSLAAAAIFAALTPVLSTYTLICTIISLATLAYQLLLLRSSGIRFGRATICGAALVIMVLAFYLAPPLAVFALLHIGLIWLTRCFYYHSSIFIALGDLGISLLGFAAAIWAIQHSNSLFLAFWCFFLVQALVLPALQAARQTPSSQSPYNSDQSDHNRRFQRAYRSAESTLRKASAPH